MPLERTSRIVFSALVQWTPVDDSGDAQALQAVVEGTREAVRRNLAEYAGVIDVDVTPLAWMDITPALAEALTEG